MTRPATVSEVPATSAAYSLGGGRARAQMYGANQLTPKCARKASLRAPSAASAARCLPLRAKSAAVRLSASASVSSGWRSAGSAAARGEVHESHSGGSSR